MKNAMKKLMSVLLVAVLLISAVPFAASATVWEDDGVATQNNNDSAVVFENNGVSTYEAPAGTLGKTQVVLNFNDGTASQTYYPNLQENATVQDLLVQVLGADGAKNLIAKYRRDTGDWNDVVDYTLTYLSLGFNVRTFSVVVKVNGTNKGYATVNYGDTVTLNKDMVTKAGHDLGVDNEIDYFVVGDKAYNVGDKITITADTEIAVVSKATNSNTTTPTTPSTTATYVDVILVTGKTSGFNPDEFYRCTLVDNKITKADRDKVATLVAGKNYVAWKRGDNNTQTSSLVNFDFTGLTQAINIYPVVGTTDSNNGSSNTNGKYTLTFKSDSNTVLYTVSGVNGKLTDDQKAIVNLAAKAVPTISGGTFNGMWQVNGGATSNVATSTITDLMSFDKDYTFVAVYTKNASTGTSSKKDLNDIILNIFVNKDFNNCKTIKLNGYSILDDDKITLNEIMNSVVTTYYKATDSNKGLQGDGLYYTTGSFMYNWLTDAKKVDAIDDIAAKRAEGTVTINIMVTNATAKSTTTTADSSNPKTGDSIYTAMTVMGISATTLAAVMYVYTKKRQAI